MTLVQRKSDGGCGFRLLELDYKALILRQNMSREKFSSSFDFGRELFIDEQLIIQQILSLSFFRKIMQKRQSL